VSETLAFLKTAHVLSAAIVFGTGLGIAFFCWFGYRMAMRSGDIGTLRSVLHLTVIADAIFTAPAVLIQAITGIALMYLYGWAWLSAWSVAVWNLFLLTGACWLPVVAIQIRLSRTALQAESTQALPDAFHADFRRWLVLGIPAFSSVLLLYYLMVAKPLAVA
jgi:uncharacterized membrane protein